MVTGRLSQKIARVDQALGFMQYPLTLTLYSLSFKMLVYQYHLRRKHKSHHTIKETVVIFVRK